MNEQLITFETAKLAKEKGFKLQSNPFGYTTKFYNHNTKTLLAYGRTGRTDLSKAYYAPTQSLLQRWLREVHNIHIAILPKILPSNEVKYYCFKGKLKKDFENLYNTYEEALEVGLFEALKLIKDETKNN